MAVHIEVVAVRCTQKRPVNVYRPLINTNAVADNLQVVVVAVTTHFVNVVLLKDFASFRHFKP